MDDMLRAAVRRTEFEFEAVAQNIRETRGQRSNATQEERANASEKGAQVTGRTYPEGPRYEKYEGRYHGDEYEEDVHVHIGWHGGREERERRLETARP